MSEVIIFYRGRQPDGAGFEYKKLPHVPGKDLRGYLRDVHLITRRLRSKCHLDGNQETLRFNYIPKPGDRIVLEPAGRAMS